MTRLIDADAIDKRYVPIAPVLDWGTVHYEWVAFIDDINELPTIDAVPAEFVMENCNLEFVCYALTEDGEWCSEHCQYSEPQPECIHRYIDRIWRKEHDKAY